MTKLISSQAWAFLCVTLNASGTATIKAMWESIAKKFNGRGLQGISMACGGLMLWIGSPSPSELLAQCVLCALMFNVTSITVIYESLNSCTLVRVNHEVSRNDQKLLFS